MTLNLELHINNINYIKSHSVEGTAYTTVEARLNAYYASLDDNVLIALGLA